MFKTNFLLSSTIFQAAKTKKPKTPETNKLSRATRKALEPINKPDIRIQQPLTKYPENKTLKSGEQQSNNPKTPMEKHRIEGWEEEIQVPCNYNSWALQSIEEHETKCTEKGKGDEGYVICLLSNSESIKRVDKSIGEMKRTKDDLLTVKLGFWIQPFLPFVLNLIPVWIKHKKLEGNKVNSSSYF